MTKSATVWRPLGGQGDVTNDNEGDFLLLEDNSSHLLLENGDDIILEDSVVRAKSATVWSES